MQERETSIREILDSIVPITRFNRGEASKIFDEVDARGVKVVLKNNDPVCVLVQPERYESMVDALEDYALYFEAERRIKASGSKTISQEELLKDLGIDQTMLNNVKVDIE